MATPEHHGFAQRCPHAGDRLAAVAAPGDELGEQRVVVDRDLAPLLDARVEPHSRALGGRVVKDAARGGQVVAVRVLGVEAALEGVALRVVTSSCGRAGGSPARHLELQPHEIEAGDRFRHGVLDLQPRVHLQEVEAARRRRAGTRRCPRSRSPAARAAATPAAHSASRWSSRRGPGSASPPRPSGAGAGSSTRARRGARPGPAASARTCTSTCRGRSRRRSRTIASSPKADSRLAPAGRERRARNPRGRATTRMPLPPPPRDGLIITGQPMRSGLGEQGGVLLVVAVVARHHGHARRGHEPPRALLVAHPPVHAARRAHEDEAGPRHRVGEVAVLAQEPVAGMDRVGPRATGRVEHRVDREVRRAPPPRGRWRRPRRTRGRAAPRVGFGIDGHRGEARGPGRCGRSAPRSRRGWR